LPGGKLAGPREALHLMDPRVVEGISEPSTRSMTGAETRDLVARSDSHDPSRRMDGDRLDVAGNRLDLSGMYAGAYREAEGPGPRREPRSRPERRSSLAV
jgi:hypothetical protein